MANNLPSSFHMAFVSILFIAVLCPCSINCWMNFNDWNTNALGSTSPGIPGLGDDGEIIQEPLSDDALHKLTSSLANSMSSSSSTSSDNSHSDHSSSDCDHSHHDHDHNHRDHGHGMKEKDDLEMQGYEKWDDHFAREKRNKLRNKGSSLRKKNFSKRKDRGYNIFKNGGGGGKRRVNRYDEDRDYDRHRDGHHDHDDRDRDRDHDHSHHDDSDGQDFQEPVSESRRGLRRWFGRGRRSRGFDKGRRYGSSYNSEDNGGAIEGGDYDDEDFGSAPSLMGRLRRRLFRW